VAANPDSRRVIPGSEASEAPAWKLPNVGKAVKKPSENPVTVGQLNKLHQSAHEDGFAQGRKEGQELGRREGIEQGRQQIQQKLDQFDRLLDALNQPFKELDDQVEQEVVTLVISLLRQLVRREVKLDPSGIVGVVREALMALPVASRNIRVVIHPEDAALLREVVEMSEAKQNWVMMEDPLIQRGGCKVMTDTSQIDATLETRINHLISPLLSNERLKRNEKEQDERAPQ